MKLVFEEGDCPDLGPLASLKDPMYGLKVEIMVGPWKADGPLPAATVKHRGRGSRVEGVKVEFPAEPAAKAAPKGGRSVKAAA